LFTFQLGGYVYDSQYGSLMSSGNYGNAKHVDVLNAWQKPGDQTNIPRMDGGNTSNLSGGSSRYLTKASYLNLNSITLGYNLPKNMLNTVAVKEAYIFLSGENLAFFNKRKGMNNLGAFNGVVDNTYNFNRLFTVGARIKF